MVLVPLMKRLRGCLWNISVFSPWIQTVVDCEMRQDVESGRERCCRDLIQRWITQDLVCHAHGLLLYGLNLPFLLHYFAPTVDLFMNVDLYRADIGATAV